MKSKVYNKCLWSILLILGNYTTVDLKKLHKSHRKFWRQAQSTDTASQTSWGDKLGDKPRKPDTASQTSWKTDKKKTSPGRRKLHPRQDWKHAGGQDLGQEKDKTRRGTKHPRPPGRQAERQEGGKTGDRGGHGIRPDARQARRQDRRQAKRGGHSIPAKTGDKLGDKTGDKRKTRPARRTQHPNQGGNTKKASRTPTSKYAHWSKIACSLKISRVSMISIKIIEKQQFTFKPCISQYPRVSMISIKTI